MNAGYFGLGNATPAIPQADGTFVRRYQAITEEVRARINVRVPIRGPFDAMFGLQAALHGRDGICAQQARRGCRRRGGRRPVAGPRNGTDGQRGACGRHRVRHVRQRDLAAPGRAFDIVGARAGFGVPASRGVLYGGGSVVLRRYVPLVGPLVLAGRFVGDVIAGEAPLYDLQQGVTFTPVDLIGGHGGLRGVPNGRYTGENKKFGSVELRALVVTFGLLGQRFRVGTQAFVDVGRVWSDFNASFARDGRGLGLKYGGGFYVIWGEAAVIRVEMAHSPDALSANAGLPIGLYVADGHAF